MALLFFVQPVPRQGVSDVTPGNLRSLPREPGIARGKWRQWADLGGPGKPCSRWKWLHGCLQSESVSVSDPPGSAQPRSLSTKAGFGPTLGAHAPGYTGPSSNRKDMSYNVCITPNGAKARRKQSELHDTRRIVTQSVYATRGRGWDVLAGSNRPAAPNRMVGSRLNRDATRLHGHSVRGSFRQAPLSPIKRGV